MRNFLVSRTISFIKKDKTSFLLNSIYFFTGVLLFTVPVVYFSKVLVPFVPIKSFVFMFLVEILLVLFLFLIILSPRYRPKANYVYGAFLLFILVSIISGILGVDPAFSFWSGSMRADGIILLCHVFIFFFIMATAIKNNKVMDRIILCSIFSSVAIAMSTFIPIEVNGMYLSSGGLVGNDSFVGAYLLFNVFFIVYLFYSSNNSKIKQLMLFIPLVIILFSPVFFNFDIFHGLVSLKDLIENPKILLGSARAAEMGLLAGVVLALLLLYIKSSRQKINKWAKIAMIIFLATSLILVIYLFIPGSRVNNILMKETGGYRAVYWHQALEGFKEKPLLGWGAGNFKYVNMQYYDSSIFNQSSLPELFSDKAHNIVFDTLINSGIVGLLAYVGILVCGLMMLWKSDKITYQSKAILTGLFFAYFLQNLVFFDVLVTYIMFALLLAIIAANDKSYHAIVGIPDDVYYRTFSKKYIKTLALIIISVTTVFSIRYFVFLPFKQIYSDYKFYKSSPEERYNFFEQRKRISPFGERDDFKLSTYLLYEQNSAFFSNNSKKSGDRIFFGKNIYDIDQQITLIKKEYKTDVESYEEYHAIHELNSLKFEILNKEPSVLVEMEKSSKKETELAPGNLNAFAEYAHVLYLKGNYFGALDILEKIAIKIPLNPVLHERIIEIARETSNKNLVEEKIKRANEYLPEFDFK